MFVEDLRRCVEALKIGVGLVLLTYVIVSFSWFQFFRSERLRTIAEVWKASNHVSKRIKSKKIVLKITRRFAKELRN